MCFSWYHFVGDRDMHVFCAFVLYIVGALALAYFMIVLSRKVEQFESDSALNSQICFKCMDFFASALQLTDTSELVPYIKQRAEFVKYVLWQFRDFIENIKCEPKGGVGAPLEAADLQRCFLERVAFVSKECEKELPRSDCALASTLGDRLLTETLKCGSEPCTAADFKARFKTALNAMIDDLEQCRAQFDEAGEPCVKLYEQVILTKNQPAVSANSQASGASPLTGISTGSFDQAGMLTSFVMNNL